MGKLGSFEYPDNTIEECAEIVETIDEFDITKQELLAEKLGHDNPESGTFRGKLTSLRRYGLTTGRGDIQLTSLGQKVANPVPNTKEMPEALGKAALNVPLLEELFNRLEYDRIGDEFWFHLVEIADIERSEAKQKASEIRRLYENSLPYVQELNREGGSGKSNSQSSEKASRSEDEKPDRETMAESADAKLVTENAQIEIVDKSTFVAAQALFDELAKKYEDNQDGG